MVYRTHRIPSVLAAGVIVTRSHLRPLGQTVAGIPHTSWAWPSEKVVIFRITSGYLDQRELLEYDEVELIDLRANADACG